MLGVEVGNDPFDGRMLYEEILDGMFRSDTGYPLKAGHLYTTMISGF